MSGTSKEKQLIRMAEKLAGTSFDSLLLAAAAEAAIETCGKDRQRFLRQADLAWSLIDEGESEENEE